MQGCFDPRTQVRQRLSRHFVARLRQEAELGAFEQAFAIGVLERVQTPAGWSVYRNGKAIAGWAMKRVRLLLSKSFGLHLNGSIDGSSHDSNVYHCQSDEDVSEMLWKRGGRRADSARVALIDEGTQHGIASCAAKAAQAEVVDEVIDNVHVVWKPGHTPTSQHLPGVSADVHGAATAAASAVSSVSRPKAQARRRRQRELDRLALVRLVRCQATPPLATEVATLLMLADAVARSGHDLAEVLCILRRPRPIIAITGTVQGFEESFLDLLKRGFVLPGTSKFLNGYDLRSFNEFRHSDGDVRSLIVFRGRELDDASEIIERQISLAARNTYPILAIADEAEQIPAALIDAADIHLVCSPVIESLILETMRVVLGRHAMQPQKGERAKAELPDSGSCGGAVSIETDDDAAADTEVSAWSSASDPKLGIDLGVVPSASLLKGCTVLHLSHLGLGIRPGLSFEKYVTALRALIERQCAGEARQSSVAKSDRTYSWPGLSKADSSRRRKVETGSMMIEPEPIEATDGGNRPLQVETLSGYGEATGWALGLGQDLSLWKAGQLGWPDMSTRLLLAGPPGTGKTTFARALGNTLQLKLFATSVGTWLEPSHLGDVLARMSAAFAEAQANAPCILFIDEIDGIGRRGRAGRNYDDYWNSVVNGALELIDGAQKTQGVIIVGATNHPEAIDPALLRSGRLETRVDIPLPDVDALVGILRHHLGDDVAGVVTSAEPPTLAEEGGTSSETNSMLSSDNTNPWRSGAGESEVRSGCAADAAVEPTTRWFGRVVNSMRKVARWPAAAPFRRWRCQGRNETKREANDDRR